MAGRTGQADLRAAEPVCLNRTAVIDNPPARQQAIDDTQAWLLRAVIGLNLCPFAKAVHVKAQIRYAVSSATRVESVLADLVLELKVLERHDSQAQDTTLLIAPFCLDEFLDFNALLARADRLLVDLALDGVYQIASFHPQFQFAGTAENDITNYTNRSPYPMLHILREASVARAVEAFAQAEEIFEKNMQTLTDLGLAGWAALDVGPHPAA
jgi:uncharacterized protein